MLFHILSALLLPMVTSARIDCSKTEYERCVRIADPLVKEAHLVFPDNMDDIDLVCRTWNRFVDCLKTYTDECFTDQQRKTFNRAVESPIESVHQMCMQPSYQKEYLQYAPCIKNTITERIHCGPHYNLLVDQVSQGDIISKSTLCCSHDRFKQCVQRETRRLCDRGISDGPATTFATQIIDKALNFLQDQCLNYIPNSGDCTTLTTDTLTYSDPLLVSTSSSEIYPWSTIQDNPAPKEILPSKIMPPKVSSTTTWLPSSDNSHFDTSSTQLLGSRTRPASYGRSGSWSENPDFGPVGNTVQMYPNSPTTPSTKPEWATVTSWNTMGRNPSSTRNTGNSFNPSSTPKYPISFSTTPPPSTSSETWYPAAGHQVNNEVDEPNQLGLKKPRNNGSHFTSTRESILSFGTIAIILILFC